MIDTSPPEQGPHTVSRIVYDEVPNFMRDALPRTYVLVVDEAGGGDIAPSLTRETLAQSFHRQGGVSQSFARLFAKLTTEIFT